MDSYSFELHRAALPDGLPSELTLDLFEGETEFSVDSSTPDAAVWKANGAADRRYSKQPPLRWRLYEVKTHRNLKMDLIWHPKCPQLRIARLRFVAQTKSNGARKAHERRRRERERPPVTLDWNSVSDLDIDQVLAAGELLSPVSAHSPAGDL